MALIDVQPNLIQPGETVLVAVSGGADSVALLHTLCALSQQGGFSVAACHVEHGIRGQESLRDAAFVQALCTGLGVLFVLKQCNAPQFAAESKQSLETAARTLRYQLLCAAAEELHAQKIALAHHQNDQAETVLMHILRGSALKGAVGMQPVSKMHGKTLIRPFLSVSKAEILAQCAQNGWEYRTDSTNISTVYTRNHLRAVLESLQTVYPDAGEKIATFAQNIAPDEAYLSAVAQVKYDKLVHHTTGGVVVDEFAKFLPSAIRNRLLYMAARPFGELSGGHVRLLSQLLQQAPGTGADLPGCRVLRIHGGLQLGAPQSGEPFYIPFAVGEHVLPHGTLCVQLQPPPKTVQQAGVHFLDAGKVPPNAVIRSRKSGDMFWALGSGGHTKLKEYLIDKKIPSPLRATLPLIAQEHAILYIAGTMVGEEVKVLQNTKAVYCIVWRPNTLQ